MNDRTAELEADAGIVFNKRWHPLIVVVAITIVINLLALAQAFLNVSTGQDFLLGVFIGVPFGQASIAAIVIALLHIKLSWRLSFIIPTLSLAAISCAGMIHDEVAIVIASAILTHFLLSQLPLWKARLSGWRITAACESSSVSHARGAAQFGLRQLMLWTLIAAILFALCRALIANVSKEFLAVSLYERVFIAFVLFAAAFLLVFPVLWGSFVQRYAWAWLLLVPVWTVVVHTSEFLCLAQLVNVTEADRYIFAVVNSTQVITAAACCIALRFAGFRLARIPDAGNSDC